ncbi:hypothetical protein Tco_0951151 [Tanacetum coccineum]|uniref:Uncharacterized protein n=1 Tax=Tanacetum coccineum TaxID=301880 RepID=A0ABQ5DW27_9ASTR
MENTSQPILAILQFGPLKGESSKNLQMAINGNMSFLAFDLGGIQVQFDCIRGVWDLDVVARKKVGKTGKLQYVMPFKYVTGYWGAYLAFLQCVTLENQTANAKWHEHLAFDLQSAV